MLNDHEVELRVLLQENEHAQIFEKLKSVGAVLRDEENLTDIYFCPKEVTSFSGVEMDEVGSFGLRLRQTITDGKTKNDLNIKIITSYADHHAWEEHEVEVDSLEEMKAILKGLGFKAFVTIEKKRSNYTYQNMLVIVEDIKDFGLGIEVEIKISYEKREEAKVEIKKFLQSIGIGEEKIVPKSITNIIMREKAEF
jgi:predicted adenylyl cyclase CyaB